MFESPESFGLQFAWVNSMNVRGFIASALLFSVVSVGSMELKRNAVSGVTLPEEITVSGTQLRLNGLGVRREKLLFKTYVIGLYLEKSTTDAGTAIEADVPKRFVIRLLRDVNRQTFVQAIESGIMRNSEQEMPMLRARLDLLEQALPDLCKGDVLSLTWLPGTGTVIQGKGRTMTIPGKDFSDALFSVWLGSNPVEASLRRALLGG
jgi:Chalcone isomerase-like